MRLALIISAALAFLFSNPVIAADDPWFTYVSREDRFALNLPGQPKIEEFTYSSEYNTPWQARRHTVEHEGYLYRMTVVDMSTTNLTADSDVGRSGIEKRGAMAFAASNLRKTGEVILDTYDQVQVIPGLKLEIILPEGRLNLVELHTYDELLYILECISPSDAIPAYYVQSSLELLNADLIVPRYQNVGFPGPIPLESSTARAPAAAGNEGLIAYVSREERFAVTLPGQPMVEEFIYTSAQYSPWNARRYTVEHDGHQYSMTVVDMSTTRLTPDIDQFRNTARPGSERSGALAFAAWNLRMTGQVEVDRYIERQVIPGLKLEIILPDGRRNVAEIYEHSDFLYIWEHISRDDAVPGFDVQGSLELLDANGNVPRYVDDNRTFPDFMTMTGDGTAAAGRDLGAEIRGAGAAP